MCRDNGTYKRCALVGGKSAIRSAIGQDSRRRGVQRADPSRSQNSSHSVCSRLVDRVTGYGVLTAQDSKHSTNCIL